MSWRHCCGLRCAWVGCVCGFVCGCMCRYVCVPVFVCAGLCVCVCLHVCLSLCVGVHVLESMFVHACNCASVFASAGMSVSPHPICICPHARSNMPCFYALPQTGHAYTLCLCLPLPSTPHPAVTIVLPRPDWASLSRPRWSALQSTRRATSPCNRSRCMSYRVPGGYRVPGVLCLMSYALLFLMSYALLPLHY